MKPRRAIDSASLGFSLVEVLVAAAVLAIVLTILLGVLSTSLGLWRGTEGKLQVDREGRSAMLLLAQDLAGVIVPANTNLWPRVEDDCLQFLTIKPSDYQSPEDQGDVCFVEYYFDEDSAALKRTFRGSQDTYTDILTAGNFPDPEKDKGMTLADNILDSAPDAVRGLVLEDLMTTDSFIILNTNLTRLYGAYTADNRPAAVEVNIAATDATSMYEENQAAWRGNPDLTLRSAGIYSFRAPFPAPPAP